LARNASSHVFLNLDAAFFGTIDSFFSSLLTDCAEFSSYGNGTQIVETGGPQETRLWQDFLDDEAADWTVFLPQPHLDRLLQLCPWKTLAEAARSCVPCGRENLLPPPFPEIQWQRLLANETANLPQILVDQINLLRSWRKCFEKGLFAPLSISERWSSKPLDGVPFATLCAELWSRPLAMWVEIAGGILCGSLGDAYAKYRLSRGFATYDDLRRCARKLMENDGASKLLRGRNYRIVIDEAQDTAPEDFEFLLNLVPSTKNGPAQGHFSMVGDMQQCIYLRRCGEFEKINSICSSLVDSGTLEQLTFTVTMRCPLAVVENVNNLFPNVLCGTNQAKFVAMECPANCRGGGVFSMILDGAGRGGANGQICEMEALAAQFAGKSPQHFAVERWGEIAILGGIKKTHLATLQRIFSEMGVPAQLRLRGQKWHSKLLFRWICGILRIISCPTDCVEIVAVLREIFAVPDGAVAKFLQNRGGEPLRELFSLERSGSGQLELLVGALGKLRLEVMELNVAEALVRIDEKLNLVERANRCEANAIGENLNLWGDVVNLAYGAVARGQSLAEFCESLLEKYFDGCEPDEPDGDRIQIDTLHGSKGLEWNCVILAFCGRAISSERGIFPRHAVIDGQPKLFMKANTPLAEEYEAQCDGERLAATQRLLYVAMTRARETLILARDGLAGKPNGNSPAELMAVDFSKLKPWKAEECKCAKVSAGKQVAAQNITIAAGIHGHRRSMAANKKSEVVDDKSVTYGNWWHRTMEYFPWNSRRQHRQYVADALGKAPDFERGERELTALLASAWYGNLHFDSLKFFAEWPFASELESTGELAGSTVDLVIFDSMENRLTVLDWKTDLIGREDIPRAMERHGMQLLRYASFFRKCGNWPVAAAIYFSNLGELIGYDLSPQLLN
ncbi:MAG: UvrD-helicase domain-containing protein, partial [Puniceicoccales bacterium]|jgi:superfamily I DNA/RNA helicase|nr:UvrD-helicase domain-containing protein [Puniceicoccales bacterium]